MSDCLLTKLPVEVPGDWEKLGYFMFKKNDSSNASVAVHRTSSVSVFWNEYSEYAAAPEGYDPPYVIEYDAQYPDLSLIFKSKSNVSYEKFAGWVEIEPVTAITFSANVVIPANRGFEILLGNNSNLDYLRIRGSESIPLSMLKSTRLKCLRMIGGGLQPYICQSIIENIPSLRYIMFDNPITGYECNDNVTRNIQYPDNLRYIRNAPTRIEYLSANCEECLLNNTTRGSVEDYVAKAVAADRQDGVLSCMKRTALSANLMFDENTTLAAKLESEHIATTNFKIVWSTLDSITTITLEAQVTEQVSRNINVDDYINLDLT